MFYSVSEIAHSSMRGPYSQAPVITSRKGVCRMMTGEQSARR